MSEQDKATDGPWVWRVNPVSKRVHLEGHRPPTIHEYVMDFVRWGMGNAQPRFNIGVMMQKVSTMSRPRGNPDSCRAEWDHTFDHPDAQLIADAPAMKLALDMIACGVADFNDAGWFRFDGTSWDQRTSTWTDVIGCIGWDKCRHAVEKARRG